MKLTDAEWAVLEALWSADRLSLAETTRRLAAVKGWSKNTVHTYLTRMEGKGLVSIDHSHPQPYSAAVTREECARAERRDLLDRVYSGAAGNLIAAFLKDSPISKEEAASLRQLLDEMEV